MKRRLLTGVLVLAVTAGLIWAWTAYERSVARLAKTGADLNVDVSAETVTLIQGEGGQARWRLEAQSARYDNERGLVEVVKPQVRYYTGQDQAELLVNAPQGLVDRGSDSATLWPEVTAQYGDMSLRADKLVYLGKNKTLEMTGRVELRRAGMELNAPTVVVDVTSKNVQAMSGVTAVLPPQGLPLSAPRGASTDAGDRS